MAQRGFVPRWLNISTPQSAKSPAATFENHGQHLHRGEGRFGVSGHQHNGFNQRSSQHQPSLLLHYSMGSGLAKGGAFAGITGSPSAWHGSSWGHDGMSQLSWGATENHPHWNGSLHARKASATQEKPPTETRKGKEEHKVEKLKLGQKDFPALNPETGKQHQPCRPPGTPSGVWKNPPSAKQPSKMLVIQKVSTDGPAAAFSAAFISPGPHHAKKNKSSTTFPSVYRNLVLKPIPLPSRPSPWKANGMAHRSAGTSTISVSKPVALAGGTVLSSPKERPPGTSPPMETRALRLTKVTRRRPDKRSASLKILKYNQNRDFSGNRGRDKLEDWQKDPTAKLNENGEGSCLHNSLAVPILQEEKVLWHSLEAEHTLLTAMGWQEYPENEEDCLPLTEDELREFQAKTEQLRRNGFGKKGFSQGCTSSLISPWRSAREAELEDSNADTSDTDTSDDEAWE
ncbi:vasculin-like protein 1 [Trichechus inunguis]